MSAHDQYLTRLMRRQWLARAGLLAGAGLLAACAPAAPPTSAPAAASTAAAKPSVAAQTAPASGAQRGGSLVWALNSDPVNRIPYGAVPTQNHWGKEFMYDSLLA